MATTITANGINFPDGSAAAPSIGGTDTNTGLFTGSDIVGFATGGNERLRIASDGKILMGVAANNGPAAPLHIYGGSNTTPILAFTRSSTHDDWQGGGIGLVDEGGTYKGALTFYTHSSSGTKNDSITEKLRITSAGLVLLGTTNPSGYSSRKLTVAAASGGSVIEIRTSTTDAGQISFSDGYAADDTAYRGYIQYQHNGDYMRFATASTEKLIITSTGNVGIGTTSPSAKLQVGGATIIGTANTTKTQDGVIIERNSGDGLAHITAGRAGGNYSGMNFYVAGASGVTLRQQIDYQSNFKFFGADGTSERLRIASNGNVVINSATSGEAKLDVHGGVAISSNSVAVSPSGYDLKIRSNTSKLGIHCDAGSGTPILEFGTGGSTGCFITNLDNTPMRFGTQNTERMRIQGDGKIGIGTTAPPDKLNVVGAVRINQSSALDHLCNAGTMLEVRGDGIGSGVVDYDFFKGFKIALNDGTEYGGQAQFAVGRWEENGTNARSSLMISLGHGAQSSVSNADTDILLLTSDGQVEIEDGNLKIGTAGHGIDFGVTSDAANNANVAELLDDYEEGRHIVSITGSSSNPTVNLTMPNLWYVKVGSLVTLSGELRWTTSSHGSGTLRISLPFAAKNLGTGHSFQGTAQTWNIDWKHDQSSTDYILSEVGGNTSYMFIRCAANDNLSEDSLKLGSNVIGSANSGYGVELCVSLSYRAE